MIYSIEINSTNLFSIYKVKYYKAYHHKLCSIFYWSKYNVYALRVYWNLFYRFQLFCSLHFIHLFCFMQKIVKIEFCLTNAYSIYLEWIERHTKQKLYCIYSVKWIYYATILVCLQQNSFWQWQKFNCMPNLVFKLVAFLNATRQKNPHFVFYILVVLCKCNAVQCSVVA